MLGGEAGPTIRGGHGNIQADGAGYAVTHLFTYARSLKTALENLTSISEVWQLGETEAVGRLPGVPTAHQARTLRSVFAVKKVRAVSEAEKAGLQTMGFKRAPKRSAITGV